MCYNHIMFILKWQVLIGCLLILTSTILYFVHYLIFHESRLIFFYLMLDMAFIPIQVLVVTLIINELLSIREKRSRIQKMNMIVGAFFTEIGTALLTYLSDCDPKINSIRGQLLVSGKWTGKEFKQVGKKLSEYDYPVDIERVDLNTLKNILNESREFILRLLENQNLLEHEQFTSLLWAILHLIEELAARRELACLPSADLAHLKVDTERVYNNLGLQWLEYMQNLKTKYPYLFSLAMRTNPFDEKASVVIKD